MKNMRDVMICSVILYLLYSRARELFHVEESQTIYYGYNTKHKELNAQSET